MHGRGEIRRMGPAQAPMIGAGRGQEKTRHRQGCPVRKTDPLEVRATGNANGSR
jgi:hypothetical protein